MRPTITHLLQRINVDVSYRDTHIFIRAFPKARQKHKHLMDGPDVNIILQKLSQSLPLQLTCNLLHQMFMTMHEQQSPNPLVISKKKLSKEENSSALE